MSLPPDEKQSATTPLTDGGADRDECSVAAAATATASSLQRGAAAAPPPAGNASSNDGGNEASSALKSTNGGGEKPMSKKQLKRQKKWERTLDRKRRRKQQEKEIRLAKALADGRDLDEERRIAEERTKSGEGHRRREEEWLKRMKSADTSFRVCVDCGFNHDMTQKELNSLSSQIRYCYSSNRKSDYPVYLSVASLEGIVRDNLNKVEGFPTQWEKRAFSCSEAGLLDIHSDKSKLVYLTSDSENTLQHLDHDKTYIIGGIVDRNRLKRAAIDKAESLGLQTARLPISDHLELVTTKVLTCNHVFDVLMKYRENGNDWKKAMLDVLPNRKDAHEKDVPSSSKRREGA